MPDASARDTDLGDPRIVEEQILIVIEAIESATGKE